MVLMQEALVIFLLLLFFLSLALCYDIRVHSDARSIDNTSIETGNAEDETGNAEDETGNAEDETGNAEGETGNAEGENGNAEGENGNEEEKRSDLIRSRLVLQQVLSLRLKEKGSTSSKRQKSSNKRKHAPNDHLSMVDGNDTDVNTIDSKRSIEAASSIRSMFASIRLRVFNHDDRVKPSDEEKKLSIEALRYQPSCSICLEDYAVGDVVARLKTNVSSETSTCNHCFHEDCILEWLEKHDECPLCRVNMVSSNV